MSTLEISILIAGGVLLLAANLVASFRLMRRLGRYSSGYVLFIWLAPVIGALYVFAKLKRAPPARWFPINVNTIDNPSTLQADPWPTLNGTTRAYPPFHKR